MQYGYKIVKDELKALHYIMEIKMQYESHRNKYASSLLRYSVHVITFSASLTSFCGSSGHSSRIRHIPRQNIPLVRQCQQVPLNLIDL